MKISHLPKIESIDCLGPIRLTPEMRNPCKTISQFVSVFFPFLYERSVGHFDPVLGKFSSVKRCIRKAHQIPHSLYRRRSTQLLSLDRSYMESIPAEKRVKLLLFLCPFTNKCPIVF